MTIYIKIKAISSRKPIIDRLTFIVNPQLTDSNALISHIVRQNVQEYNQQTVDAPLFPHLTNIQITDKESTGRITFNDRKNENQQDEDAAIENALTSFKDGIFRMFINDQEIKPSQAIALNEGDEVTFIRLTMLSGRMW